MTEDEHGSADDAIEGQARDDRAGLDRLDRELRQQREQQEQTLRERYARVVLIGAGIQVGLADLVFIIYAVVQGFQLPTAAITAWLAAIVVEVLGVVALIAKGLFPPRSPDN